MAADSLTLPRAELFALLLRAARGAKLPLGHAEELARAVGAHGQGEAVEAALIALEAGWRPVLLEQLGSEIRFVNARAVGCLPVALDALQGDADVVWLDALDEPALIPPYLARAEEEGRGCIRAEERPGGWLLECEKTVSYAAPTPRVTVPLDVHEGLKTLAALTYVPATDASRAGAGAGSIDNE